MSQGEKLSSAPPGRTPAAGERGEPASATLGRDRWALQMYASPRLSAQRATLAHLASPIFGRAAQQTRPNADGLPLQLKAGVEALFGLDMSPVRVHRDSDEPAQIGALAYAQGNDIHLGPGQEEHLAHETCHVVQQKQGRVPATAQAKSLEINDDPGLEREADVMGAQVLTFAQESSARSTSDSGAGMQPGSVASSGGCYASKVASSARQQAQRHLLQGLFSATAGGSKSSVVQGRFLAGYTALNRVNLDPVWEELLIAIPELAAATPVYMVLADSPNDEGTFYRWLQGQVQAIARAQHAHLIQQHGHADVMEVDPWVRAEAILTRHGITDGALRAALRAMGGIAAGQQPRDLSILNLENVKNQELAVGAQWQDAPPSPRHESRLLQIPRLVERLDRAFRSRPPLLPFFDYILGGGAAMAIKRPMLGRLGRASTNMRDIDMDFQVAPGRIGELREYLQREGIGSLLDLMNRVCVEMSAAINAIDEPELAGALRTDDVRVSGRNTVMFNKEDLEYSFHFVNDEPLLGFDEMRIDNGRSIKVIGDDSHWALTKSALRARLKRPDKIQKTLIDALVQIGPPGERHNERMTQTAAIVFGGARGIATARNTLRRLAGPAGPPDEHQQPQWPRQPIVGLPNAAEWQRYLDARTISHYDRDVQRELTPQQTREVRDDYGQLFDQIIASIIGLAGNGRPDIAHNAVALREQVAARFAQVRNRRAYGSPRLSTRRFHPEDAPTLRRPDQVEHEHTLFPVNVRDVEMAEAEVEDVAMAEPEVEDVAMAEPEVEAVQMEDMQ